MTCGVEALIECAEGYRLDLGHGVVEETSTTAECRPDGWKYETESAPKCVPGSSWSFGATENNVSQAAKCRR